LRETHAPCACRESAVSPPHPPAPPLPPEPRGEDADARDIRAVQAGNRDAFRGLVERHGPRVHDLARRLLKDAHLAEDVTQHAFANAWRALPRFDLARPFRHWILRITTNLCRNVHAARRIRPEVTGVRGPGDEPLDPADPNPAGDDPEGRADRAGTAPRAAHVRAAIEALPERYRLPVVLHHLHGLALDEVAEITGVPVATLKTHLFRARAALRDLLLPPETRAPGGGTPSGGPPAGSPDAP
jgi:RNA polymerase sigma-70 factor (ECF subfamily)